MATQPVDPLNRLSEITQDNRPTPFFIRQWNNLIGLVRAVVAAQATADAALPKALTSAHIFVGNASNIATDVAASGDISIANTGAVTISNGAVTEGKQTLADVTTLDVSTTKHGYAPKLPNDATKYLDGTGHYTVPPGTATSYTDEQAQDAVGNILVDSATINFTYDDGANTITADVIGSGTSSDLATAILANSPTGYWKCTEASGTVVDHSGNGFDLTTAAGTLVYQHSTLLPRDSTTFLEFNSTTASIKATTGLGLTYPLSGDWTVECIYNPAATGATLSGPRTFFSIDGGASELQANNCQIEFGISAAGGFQVRWESGAGVERVTASPLGGSASMQSNHPYHIAAVKDSGAGKISFYVNGRLQDVATAYPANTDGGSGTMVTYIGANGETATVARTIVGHVAFFSGQKLTAAQIYAHASAAGLTS